MTQDDTLLRLCPAAGTAAIALPQPGIGLLLRLRLRLLRNQTREAIRTQPLKLVGIAMSIFLIWAGLYLILIVTFDQIKRSPLEGIVAMPLIFTFFFLALTAMLAFSNAILSYGGLFRRKESAYLLVTPFVPRDVVIVKYIESLAMSSWSLLLLGLPLMKAVARVSPESWSFYPLFLGLFLLFIPLPGALGLVLAWLVAMVCPKTPKRTVGTVAVLIAAVGAWWMWDILHAPVSANLWLKNFYDRVGLIQNAMLPHTWVSKGITHALQGHNSAAAFYLFVTLANALFASVVAVAIVSHWFVPAFARAQVSGAGSIRRSGRFVGWVAEALFAYLPKRQRLLATKDLRSFFRDPLQWSQMAILLGLLVLYVSNVQRLWVDLSNPQFQTLIGFLNLTAVSLILATFTSRFVFPLISLEGQQLWLLGLLPLSRRRMVIAKFLYALTVTLLAGVAVMGVSVYRLQLPGPLAIVHLVSMVAICIGLCGVSIGTGARLPVFSERNPARIAGGFGGTISLLLSIGLVVLSLVGIAIMSFEVAASGFGDHLTRSMVGWMTAIVLANGFAAAVAMVVGIRHFNRVEI